MTLKNKELLDYSREHVAYEIEMLVFASKGVASNLNQTGVNNMRIESFGLHLRNLIDFLYLNNPKKDDVLAEDFFVNSKNWIDVRPPFSELLKHARRRANKELAHLTTERISGGTDPKKQWEMDLLVKEITPALIVFYKHADSDKLDQIGLSFLT